MSLDHCFVLCSFPIVFELSASTITKFIHGQQLWPVLTHQVIETDIGLGITHPQPQLIFSPAWKHHVYDYSQWRKFDYRPAGLATEPCSFHYCQQPLSWRMASNFCVKNGMHLANLKTSYELVNYSQECTLHIPLGSEQCFNFRNLLFCWFLVACTQLYKPLCWSIGPLVRWSVGLLVSWSIGLLVRQSVCR